MSPLPIDLTGGAGKELYQDLLSPSAKVLGDALADVVRLVLQPVQRRIDEKHAAYARLAESVARRVASVPPDRRTSVPAVIAGPVFEAAAFASDEPVLQEMYAALLATAMDAGTAPRAHPAFVEIIRQLTPDEARLIGVCVEWTPFTAHRISIDGSMWGGPSRDRVIVPFVSPIAFAAPLASPERTGSYLDNLARLGVVRRTDYEDRASYVPDAEAGEVIASLLRAAALPSGRPVPAEIASGLEAKLLPVLSAEVRAPQDQWCYRTWEYRVTDFGRQFVFACVGPTGTSE